MRAGSLRHWLVIESKAVTPDANGDRTETWATFAECWASIETSGGREFFAAKQVIGDLTHSLQIRFIAGLAPDMRVKYADQKTGKVRYFHIRAIVNPDERSEMLMLQCTEKTF